MVHSAEKHEKPSRPSVSIPLQQGNTLEVKVAGAQLSVLCDSGAQVSLGNNSLLDIVDHKMIKPIEYTCKSIVTANGSVSPVIAAYVMPVEVKHFVTYCVVHIVPNLDRILILGSSYLELYDAQLDFADKSLKLQEPIKLKPVSSVTIASKASQPVSTKVSGSQPDGLHLDGAIGIIDGLVTLPDIQVNISISSVVRGRVSVMVTNTSNTDIKVTVSF